MVVLIHYNVYLNYFVLRFLQNELSVYFLYFPLFKFGFSISLSTYAYKQWKYIV